MAITRTQEIMTSEELWLFSFRFDRRGQTNLWALESEQHIKAPVGWCGPGQPVRFEIRRDERAWIEVEKALPLDADIEAEIDEAEFLARSFFSEQFPDADLL